MNKKIIKRTIITFLSIITCGILGSYMRMMISGEMKFWLFIISYLIVLSFVIAVTYTEFKGDLKNEDNSRRKNKR